MTTAPRDYAPRRNAERDVLRNRISLLETQRILLLLVAGALFFGLLGAIVWTA